jgi:hypothetical protein
MLQHTGEEDFQSAAHEIAAGRYQFILASSGSGLCCLTFEDTSGKFRNDNIY